MSWSPAVISSITSNAIGFVFLSIPQIIILWQLLKKAGRPGWAAIIPVYNYFVVAQIAERVKLMIGLVIADIGVLILLFVTAILHNQQVHPGLSNIILLLVSVIVISILGIIILFSFIQKYRASMWLWLGLLFLPIVGVFFVDRVEYIGENSKPEFIASPPNGLSSIATPVPVTNPMPPQQYGPSRLGPIQQSAPEAQIVAPQLSSPTQPEPATNPPTQPPVLPPQV